MAQISFNVLFDWDGSGAFNFNENNYVSSLGGDESLSPPGESSFSGSGFVSEISIDLINANSRFSINNTSSPIYPYITNGAFLQKRVRVELTKDATTYTIFRGFIKSINETSATYSNVGKVKIKCRSQDDIIKNMQVSTLAATTKLAVLNQYDEGELIKRILEASGLVDNQHFRSQAYSQPTIDRGLFTIPYFWLEKESPIEDAWLLASACNGRFYYNSEDGLFYYRNAFAYGKNDSAISQTSINNGNVGSIDFVNNDAELIESISVTSRMRFITEEKEIWSSDKPIKVAPNQTITLDCDISNPIVTFGTYSYVATTAVGTQISSGISVSISSIFSKSVKLSISNTTNRMVFLRNFLITGKLLEPIDNTEYTKSSTSTFWSNKTGAEKKIDANPYVQSFAQAKAIGDISLDRQSTFATQLSVKKYNGSVFLRVGNRITVNTTNVSGDFIITKTSFNLSKSGFSQDLELLAAAGIYGLQIGDYFIIGTHSQNANKKLFY